MRLALEAGTFVRADRLVDDLWAEDAVNTRRNTLQSKVAKLRRAFGDPPVIASGDGGYTLAVEPSEVDALAVLRDSAAAAELLDAGDDRGAADLSASALERYRGDLLQGAGDGDWAAPHRARLDEARMELIETQFAARLRLGGAGDVIGELESAVATYPLPGRPVGAADHRAVPGRTPGRRAGDLPAGPDPAGGRARPRPRTAAAGARATDPGPRLGPRHRRSRRASARSPRAGREPAVAVGRARRPRDGDRCPVRPAREPAAGRDRRTGRDREDGVAIATGRRLAESDGAAPGGVWLARLETATTADDVVDTVIAALHVTGGEAALFERLKATAALVILDNCEHVLDAAAALAVRLLDAAPALRILCTSQVPLDVDGEAVFELAPLALADAVELFTRRAAARHRDRPPARLTTRCSTCAARSTVCRWRSSSPRHARRRLSIEEITRRLDDRFSVLSDPTSRRPERRRALKATIRWSYELLFPDDQRGLWALATFAGGAPAAGGRVRARGARRARVRGDRRGRPAREPFARDRRRRGSEPSATGCSTASARSRSRR